MSDSDPEFDKFLQESLSSSLVSSILSGSLSDHKSGKQSKKASKGVESEERVSSIGLSWLKSASSPPPTSNQSGRGIGLTIPTGQDDNEADEWIDSLPGEKPHIGSTRRRLSSASHQSLSEDPLNFSTGSGYSILSEIEHQLGLRGNKSSPSPPPGQDTPSSPPGQDTLNEEDEKRKFFEQLEQGRGSSLDYSDLNRQLSDTGLTGLSLRGTETTRNLERILKTIDEDITPHVSEDESGPNAIQKDPSHLSAMATPIPHPESKAGYSPEFKTSLSSHSSLSSVSQHNIKISPLHSHISHTSILAPSTSPKSSPQKLVPISGTSVPSGPHPSTTSTSKHGKRSAPKNQTKQSQSLSALPSTNPVKQVIETGNSPETGHGLLDYSQTSFTHIDNQTSDIHSKLHKEIYDVSLMSSTSSTHSNDSFILPSTLVTTNQSPNSKPEPRPIPKPDTVFISKQSPQHMLTPTTSVTNMSSQPLPPGDMLTKSMTSVHSMTNLHTNSSTNVLSKPSPVISSTPSVTKIFSKPLTSVPTKPSTTLPTKPSTTVPSKPSTTVPTKPSTNVPSKSMTNTPLTHNDRSLHELLRTLAVEELTTLSHEMMRNDEENEMIIKSPTSDDDNLSDSSPIQISSSSPNQPQPSVAMEILHQQIEQWKSAWEREKERVKEMEEQVKESVRKEERIQLEYGRQIQELRSELLEQRAKYRSLEHEKEKSKVISQTSEEQERLIQGYQKENERLYTELSLSTKELKSIKTKLLEDNNKLATELANMRVKFETQEEVVRQLRQQIESHPHSGHSEGDSERLEVLQQKLQETQDNCKKLETQVQHLLHTNQGLERQLIMLHNDRSSPIKEHTDKKTISKRELEEIKQKHQEEVLVLQEKLQTLLHCQERLRETAELMKEKDREIDSLKTKLKQNKQTKDVANPRQERTHLHQDRSHPCLIKSRTATDSRRIKELEHQVSELQKALKRRYPNSIPALIYASTTERDEEREKEDLVKYLEKKVAKLEAELARKEESMMNKMETMKKQYSEIETIYEQQIKSLKDQVLVGQRKVQELEKKEATPTDHCTQHDEKSLQFENDKLREQVSQLTLEVTHQRLQLEGLAAEVDGERRQSQEMWESKIKSLEQEHAKKMDTLVVKLAQERSESNVTRLKTRLMARESRIKQLEEELAISRVDGETLALSRAMEDDLRSQVEILTQELMESKKHHTPEMHHFNSLLAKITHLENKLAEYQTKLQETTSKTSHVTEEHVQQLELKYRRQLTEKNAQIEKFREELDTLMDTLYSLQEAGKHHPVDNRDTS